MYSNIKAMSFLVTVLLTAYLCVNKGFALATDKEAGSIMNSVAFFASTVLILLLVLCLKYIIDLKHRVSREQVFSKGIIENAKMIIIVFTPDGRVIFFNKFAQKVSGYSSKEVEGKRIDEISFLNFGTSLGKMISECIDKDINIQNIETGMTTKDKNMLYILWNVNVIKDQKNSTMRVVASGIDITDRKHTESRLKESYMELESIHTELVSKEIELKLQYDDLKNRENELKRSEERYRLAVEGVNDGIWDWDGRDGKLFMSKRSRMILGIDMDQEYITIDKWFRVIAREDVDRFVVKLNKYITEPQKKHLQIECRIKTLDGDERWIRTRGMAIWDESGIPIRVAGSITDITEQRLSDEKIHQLAYYDSLTGLPNRTLLMDRFDVAVAVAQRKNRSIAVLFLDLDNFKTINDTQGHSYGDELLMKVGEQLKLRLRRSDTIARLGGDEFVILQTNVKSIDEVQRLAARLLEVFRRPWVIKDREFFVTVSIGISIYPNDGLDLHELMKNADTAMYRAKDAGKNNFQIFSNELNSSIMERLKIENHLRKAMDSEEFILYYQPQIELKTGKVLCMEALIRWDNPAIGLAMPDSFIHIAEETGLINDIGEWVLRTACRQLNQWRTNGYDDFKVSINLSAKQFQQPNLVEMVGSIIRETKVNPEWIELEITESLAMQNLEHTISILKRFKDMGVGVSLDDFGKGYSSLNYLKQLPISNLKIDKTFIHGISVNSKQAKIAKALIALAHNMDLTVIAEGVENITQLEFLIKENCDIAQGYLFSEPKSAEEIELNSYENIIGMVP